MGRRRALLASVTALLGACGSTTVGGGSGSDAGARLDASVPDAAATRDAGGAAGADGAATDDAGRDAAIVLPVCDEVPGSDATIAFDPPMPWRGGSVRVRATAATGYTNVGVRLVGGPTTPPPGWIGVTGSGPFTWAWSVAPLPEGAWCVELFADPGERVVQRRVLVAGGDMPPTAAFKVTRNHQWTCSEEYTWAINVDVRVEDETGAPLPGTRVLMTHPPCDLRGLAEPPAELVTGDDGTVRWENYYPRCMFHLRVADAPSDTAIEIYTGIWEAQPAATGGDCNYCSTFAVNVWGHWSYSVTFARTPGATEVCELGTDHEGQSACAPLTHWEEPAGPCTPL